MSYTLSKTGAQIDAILDRADTGGAIDQSIALKAPLSSPTFTGTPTAPTPTEGDDSTQVATTAFVKSAAAAASYDLLVTDTAQGAIATFPDGADDVPVKSLIAQITPVQDLHGQSAPYPAGGGINQFNPATFAAETKSGITLSIDGNDLVLNGTATATAYFNYSGLAFSGSGSSLKFLVKGSSSNANVLFRTVPSSGSAHNYSLSTGEASYIYAYDNTVTFSGYLSVTSGTTLNNYRINLFAAVYTGTEPTFVPYSNICPISGWTGAKINATGINLCNPATINDGYRVTNTGNLIVGATYAVTDYIPVKGNTSYYVRNGVGANSFHSAAVYDQDKNYLQVVAISGSGTQSKAITTPENARFIRVNMFLDNKADFSFNYPSTDTSYHAYNGSQIDVSWADEGTVYGGTLTYIGGGKYRLQATKGYVDLGTLNYGKWDYNNSFYTSLTGSKRGDAGATLICSQYKTANYGTQAAMASGEICINAGQTIYIKDDAYASATTADFKTAMNGVQLVYDLATFPDPIILDAEDVKTLLGDNNIFTDCSSEADAVNVVYRCDTALYIDKKLGQ